MAHEFSLEKKLLSRLLEYYLLQLASVSNSTKESFLKALNFILKTKMYAIPESQIRLFHFFFHYYSWL
jgi:hypothetical protein